MGDILKFPKKEDPHITGKALCMICGHHWVAVAPVGTTWLTCPECDCLKGVMEFPCERTDLLHWTCNCGNQLMYVTPEGYYCPNCGTWCYGE